MDVAEDCYTMEKFPKHQLFGMTSQICPASSSIPANIAEGLSRGSTKGFIRFLWIANGSPRELKTHILLSNRVGWIPTPAMDELLESCERIGKMLHSLTRSLLRKTPEA